MGTDYNIQIGLVIAIIGCLIGVYGWYSGRKKDTQSEDRTLEEIRTNLMRANLQLDHVSTTTSDIKTDIKTMNNQLQEHDRKIYAMERDLKTIFNKVDEIKEDIKDAE